MQSSDVIPIHVAHTLAGLFIERVRRTPHAIAYRHYDAAAKAWQDTTWEDMRALIARWRAGLHNENLAPGDRIAIMLPNSREWVCMEQAALSLGLVVVPLFCNDRAENVGYILQDAQVKLLLIQGADHMEQLQPVAAQLKTLPRLLSVQRCENRKGCENLRHIGEWLPASAPAFAPHGTDPDSLATIVYTSGTTGKPKGVMLSHKNILSNAAGGIHLIPIFTDDLFLSFLPLSHMLERTLGYYIPMMAGAALAFARSVPQLGEDLVAIKPTVLISVPRIYERVYAKVSEQLAQKSPIARHLFSTAVDIGWENFLVSQRRRPWSAKLLLWPVLKHLVAAKIMEKLGGRLRVAICGGAALPPAVGRMFIGLGLPLIQGYGLTEASPIIAGNKLDDNIPESVGVPLQGVRVRVGDNDELLTQSDSVMLGYWNNPDATRQLIDAEGWLHTGDKVRIEREHIFITGRLKEIIVLANGEKISPADMESAIAADHLFEQVMVIGEGKPYLSALLVLNKDQWFKCAAQWGINPNTTGMLEQDRVIDEIIKRISACTTAFPGYAQIRRVALTLEHWTIDNGRLTPTLKLRRAQIIEHHQTQIDQLYAGHT